MSQNTAKIFIVSHLEHTYMKKWYFNQEAEGDQVHQL